MRHKSIALHISIAVALMTVVAACGDDAGSGDGEDWPSTTLTDLSGAALSSRDLLTPGRPAVVSIWATTCVPCKEELPRLDELAASDPGVDVAAVNLGDAPAAIASYVSDLGLSLPIAIDDEGRLAESLGVVSLPATVFVGADGRIVDVHLGELSAQQLEDGVAALHAR